MSGILEAVSFRSFWTEDQIKRFLARYVEHAVAVLHPQLSAGPVDVQTLRALLIFSTSKQHTWLVADQFTLWCILDDRRREEPKVPWSTGRDKVEPIRASLHYSQDSGVLYLGARTKEWLFSKCLFRGTDDIVESVRQLVL
jgi:hypothetical protein